MKRRGRHRARARRGLTYVELVAAILLLSIAAALSLAVWNITAQAPVDKRVTEMGFTVATAELERLKAQRYEGTSDTNGTPNVSWYDANGTWLGSGASSGAYKVKSTVGALVNRDGSTNTEDLREIVITVSNSAETKTFDTERALITFGGI